MQSPKQSTTRPQDHWQRVAQGIDIAFQPIVNIHTGTCFGYEALLRGCDTAGYASPTVMFDAAHHDGLLPFMDRCAREAAVSKYAQLEHNDKTRLFLNVDSRILENRDDGQMLALLARHHIRPGSICLELSEKHDSSRTIGNPQVLQNYKKNGFRVAIDDFGIGFSGLQLLYRSEPDCIKIDRFFISDIANDTRKASFVAHIVNLSHLLGILVIAEGVETEKEFYACKEIGCDFVQGYLIQRPTTVLAQLQLSYEYVHELRRRDRRKSSSDEEMLSDHIERVPTVCLDMEMPAIFEQFRVNKNHSFFPVLDVSGEPVGLVTEFRLKEYVYSMYGKDLLKNRSMRRLSSQFLTRCPSVDVNTEAEKILEIFSLHSESEGILITRDMKYLGFLSAKSLLKVIHEKRVLDARDQNPLTKLPGNYMIYEYLSQIGANTDVDFLVVYFDFDYFKPFNDKYGFRKGDRVIQLFAELLKKNLLSEQRFIAHIGGDDFFLGYRNIPFEVVHAEVRELIECFRSQVESFYEPEDLARGNITSRDRDGGVRAFPLMTVSAAVLALPSGREHKSMEEISSSIAELKKGAKKSPERVCAATTTGFNCAVRTPASESRQQEVHG